MTIIFYLHLYATLAMTGLIWFVQVVHYPLFNRVGSEAFTVYAEAHQNLTGLVVIPFMFMELGGASLLLLRRPEGIPLWAAVVGLALVAVLWGSTFFLQVPQHSILSNGFDETAYRTLVSTNWVRTVAWSLRGALVCWMAAQIQS